MMHRHSKVPPGFRFHPTDEELVGYYLHKKVTSRRIDLDVIREIDLYKMEPWDLQEKCRIGSAEQTEWYFFSHKDKKYPTGTRTNRATTAGFWKATGRDKMIHTKYSFVGMRKTLVFYKGRAPNGQKTDWIMHEYRLEDEQQQQQQNGNTCNFVSSLIDQDGWVVCRVFKKKVNLKGQKSESSPGFDESQTTLLPEISSSNLSHVSYGYGLTSRDHLHQQAFLCKQEYGKMDEYSIGYHDAFSRLPQLESPKVTNGGSFSMKGTSFPTEGNIIMRNTYPPTFSLESLEFDTNKPDITKLNEQFMPEVNMNEHEQLTDWRAVDKLAAAQLSQDQAMKDQMRYLENDEYSGDVALLLRLSKQEMDGSAGCDGDLWSFGKENATL